MKPSKHLLIYFLTFLFITFSCSTKETLKELEEEEETEETINCSNTDISITIEDNIVINHATNPVVWKGTYNENSVKISYRKPIGNDGESETFTFIFDKVKSCLKIKRAFKYYDGSDVDISAITEMNVSEFYTKEWIADKKFTGNVIYTDPHDKKVHSRKFWLEFTEDNLEVENTNFSFIDDCFGGKLPLDIDINKDGIVDFKIVSEKIRDVGNKPQFSFYTIKLISTNENENKILSPIRNKAPYSVVYEPPFTSENKKQYFNGVKTALDIFYEFDAPYQSFNYFLDNKLTYKGFLENNIDDYYIIQMGLGNKDYYGWIKFNFNSTDCKVEILDTFLNTTAEEHIEVKK